MYDADCELVHAMKGLQGSVHDMQLKLVKLAADLAPLLPHQGLLLVLPPAPASFATS
jgi:hypothetical protein